jgi:uncharacterized protein (DUF2384 family)
MENKLGISEELWNYGIKVFGDEIHFVLWYESPIQALGGKKPCEVDESEVRTILGRIEYGVFS